MILLISHAIKVFVVSLLSRPIYQHADLRGADSLLFLTQVKFPGQRSTGFPLMLNMLFFSNSFLLQLEVTLEYVLSFILQQNVKTIVYKALIFIVQYAGIVSH